MSDAIPYRTMWLFVFFDLPTGSKAERKAAFRFRRDLERDGFSMMQYSVYARFCLSRSKGDVHVRRVRAAVPEKGRVSILMISDRQYGEMINIWGSIERRNDAETPSLFDVL